MSIRGLYISQYERDMLTLERDMARKNRNQDLHLKLSCLLNVADGMPQRDTAENLRVPLRTLEWWVQQYRTEGFRALIKGPYPGRPARLTPEQKEELAGIIEAGPEKVGLDTGVWNACIVAALIKTLYHVAYGISQVQRILNQLSLSVQLPRKRLSKADKEMQRDWIENRLPAIKKKLGWKAAYGCIKTKQPSISPDQ
jgi:transposase